MNSSGNNGVIRIANRLRQDGYRCFYNPNRLHKLLGLEISGALSQIYGAPGTQVVALISKAYLEKPYPQQEFAAALRGGLNRIIPVKVSGAPIPGEIAGLSYASADGSNDGLVALHVAHSLENRVTRTKDGLVQLPAYGIASDSVLPLDNPRNPYSLSDVEFFDVGEKYFVDVYSEKMEFDDPLGYLSRGLKVDESNPFRGLTREMVLGAWCLVLGAWCLLQRPMCVSL